MANPVTYNQGTSIAGSLKSSVISVGVSPSLNISGYNWRNGFENNNIWVIYSDTYSQGQTTQGNAVPTIWATPVFTDAGLLNLINVLPARAGQTAFTTLSSAISWLYGENKYFLSNQNYPQIVTDGLSFIVDAGFAASYPNAGTSAYDLSVQQFTNTMQNGLVWTNNNTKSYFDFDGADDQIVINSPNNFSNITWSAGMTVQVLYKIDDLNDFNGQFRAMIGTDSGVRSFNYYLYGPSNPATTLLYHFSTNFNSGLSAAVTVQPGRYYLGTFSCGTSSGTYYHNLNVVNTQAGGTPQYNTGTSQFLGRADNLWKGNIGNWKIYNKALSADEIAQNYYQGPIVTSGLVFNIDAANLVSYPNTGTNWYNLASTTSNATLNNSPTFSNDAGGCFVFDGTDDYVSFANPLNQAQLSQVWTVQAWINIQSKPPQLLIDGLAAGLYIEYVQGNNSLLYLNGGANDYYTYGGQFTNQGWVLATFRFNNATGDRQIWRNLSNISTGGPNFTSTPASQSGTFIIGSNSSSTILGKVANVLIYNRYLTDNEIEQNYGAYQNRFESYQAYANGGTVTTITQNGVNYRVHTFTTSGTLTVIDGGSVEILMVAGGGGGGSAADSFWEAGGGGGAGGLIHSTGFDVTDGTNYTVTIGGGGAGGLNQTNIAPSNRSGNGSNTTFSTLTAVGGGGGGGAYYASTSGGSGGGAEAWIYGPGSAGTQYQGYNGGAGNGFASLNGAGGGGGGAGGPGQNGQAVSPLKGGDGGIGQSFTFTGNTPTYYAGGGGGKTAGNGSGAGGVGGLGGGGNGGVAGGSAVGTSGSANSGGGGGGGLSTSTPTGSGGSGVVMIRYIIP